MEVGDLVRRIRADAGLSLRALADAAGLATSTVHRIERGELNPTLSTLERIARAAGCRLRVEPHVDYAASIVGLARCIREDIVRGDETSPVRRAAEFAHRFDASDTETRRQMIAADAPGTSDRRWDAFVAALAEWLAVRHGLRAPDWTHDRDRYLRRGWWVTPMRAMRAVEYAGSPASFQTRGVYVHRDSLTNV